MRRLVGVPSIVSVDGFDSYHLSKEGNVLHEGTTVTKLVKIKDQ